MGIIGKKENFDYFYHLCEIGEIAKKSATILNSLINNYNFFQINNYAKKIEKLEKSADIKCHTIFDKLLNEFIAPIEREDIYSITQNLDSLIDLTYETICLLKSFNIQIVTVEIIELSKITVELLSELNEILVEFYDYKKSKTIGDKIIKINSLKNRGQTMVFKALNSIFTSNESAKNQFSLSVIVNEFKKNIDLCENICNEIEKTIIKNT